MKLTDLRTIEQLREFLSGTQAVAFSVISDKDACYRWIQRGLVKFPYLTLSRQGKGLVIGYLMKISGYSRQQLTRLIASTARPAECSAASGLWSASSQSTLSTISACWRRWMSATTPPLRPGGQKAV